MVPNAYQFYYNIQNKVDSDDTTQILITARDKGGLWKVGTIFLEREKIFRSFTLQFQPIQNLVQNMQNNSIVISTFNCLCYGIEPRVNKDISFNLLENMLTLFTTVRYFSYAKDIKEKHKIKSNKSKSSSL